MAADGWSAPAPAMVYTVATSADGSLTVAGRRDNTVVAYDRAGTERWTFATGGTVYGVAISDDGTRIAVASEDRHIYLLDGDGKQVWSAKGAQTFLSVSITGDGQIVAAGSEDRTVSLFGPDGALRWSYASGDHVTQVALYGGARGFRVVAGGRDSRVTLLNGDGSLIWQTLLSYSVRSLDVTGNGATIVAGDGQSTFYALDGGSGKILWQKDLGSAVNGVALSRDGTTLLAGTSDGTLITFDPDGNRTHEASTDGEILGLALNPGADLVAVAQAQHVALYPRGDDGAYQLPAPRSKLLLYALVIGAAIVVVAIGLTIWGMRRRPDGERVWRGAVRQRRTIGREMWRARTSYLFLVPTLVLLLVFNYYPAISGIYHAFTEWSPGLETKWVGLKQFRALGDNRYFWAGIGNLLILISTGFLKLLVPLAVAEMIFHVRSSRLGYTFRTLFVMQVIVPGVVGILLWVNVYDPNIGLANQVLTAIGLGDFTRYWFGDAQTAIWAIVFMGFPWVSAFA
ncbi:MAG: PQQ-binding-like beta-propeller repeat protein, partial [Thermomicrobiales bacterium]